VDPSALAILEGLLFFIILAVTFKALMAFEVHKYFQKGAIWQMQITVIFASLALSYLVLKAVMNLIIISVQLFT